MSLSFYVLISKKNKMYPISISWLPPHDPFIKLNTDESVQENPVSAGAGGLMRYVNGYWIWGYSMYIGNTTSTQAELWAVRQGLSI